MHEQNLPPKLDVKQFARSASMLNGQYALSKFKRIFEETQGLGAENALNWSAEGALLQDQTGSGQVCLRLKVEVKMPQICQRCLGVVEVDVRIDRSFRFVETEAQAELEDDGSPEDLLVLSQDFDLASLIEDEVLMSLPLVPRHEVCPVEVKLTAIDAAFEAETKKPNPFAVLAGLKDGKPS
jgi:uncharacterized protein